MIRDEILALVTQALEAAQAEGDLPRFATPDVTVEHPQRPEHGDFSANLPLRIQGLAKMKAMEVAEAPGEPSFWANGTVLSQTRAVLWNAGGVF